MEKNILKQIFLTLAFVGCSQSDGIKVDQTFRMVISADIPNLNPLSENDKIQSDVLSYVYETLITRDPETYDYAPLLAKSWKILKGGMEFEFELDEKAQWFDGTPVTSADIAFTYETYFSDRPEFAVLKSFYGSIDPKIQIIDERKFIVKAKTKHFNNLTLAGGMQIMPKHLLDGKDPVKGPLLNETLGTGPYVLDEWKRGEKVVLKKNPKYWGTHLKVNQGAYNFDKVQFKIVQEPKVGIELLKQGLFSQFGFTAEEWERDAKHEKIQKYYDTYTYVNKQPKGYSFIGLNQKKELFKSLKLRQALAKLLNRKVMIEKFTFGHARPAIGPIASTSDYAPKDVNPIDFDPEGAAKLLAEEGWKDSNKDGVLEKGGKKLEFELLFANPDTEKYLTMYKEDASKVGVSIQLKKLDWTTFTKLLDDKKFEAVILGWTASVDPDLKQIWHSTSSAGQGSNFVQYSNSKVDKLIEQAQGEFDKEKRIKLNQELAKTIALDLPYIWFLERPAAFTAARKGITRPKDFLNYSSGIDYWKISPQ